MTTTTTTMNMTGNMTTMTPTTELLLESIHGGLWAVMVLILIALVILWVIALKKDWYRWFHYPEWNITASSFSRGTSDTRPNNILLATRLFFLIYVLVIFILLFPDDKEGDDWQYYTNWNFYLLLLYHFLVVGYSVRGFLKDWEVETTGETNWLGKFVVLVYAVCLTNVFLVDVLYWSLLYPDNVEENPNCCKDFINITIHGLNFIVMMSELIQNRIRLTPALVISPSTFAFVYAIFQWIIGSAGLMLAYFFLDTDETSSGLWYLGIFILHIIFYYLAYGLSYVKEKYLLNPTEQTSHKLPTTSSEVIEMK